VSSKILYLQYSYWNYCFLSSQRAKSLWVNVQLGCNKGSFPKSNDNLPSLGGLPLDTFGYPLNPSRRFVCRLFR